MVEAAQVQQRAADIYLKHNLHKKDPKVPHEVVKVLRDYAYPNAEKWKEDWEELGNQFLTKLWNVQATSATSYPQWWRDLLGYTPPVR